MSLTFEHPFATVAEQMYATGYGIRPLRSARRMRPIGRLSVVMLLLALSVSLGLAIVAHGGTASQDATVVVQPGDTLWSIAAQRYPTDDVRARVDDIEQANGLQSPVIEVGELPKLPT